MIINGKLATAYQEYADTLLKYCSQKMRNREDAREVVQDSFVQAFEYLTKGNKVDDINSFLFRIANNLIIDRSRKEKNQKECEIPLESLNEKGIHPLANLDNEWVDKKLMAENVLRRMKQNGQSDFLLFLLRYVDGLKPNEIAAITGMSPNSVSVRLHRMLKRANLEMEMA